MKSLVNRIIQLGNKGKSLLIALILSIIFIMGCSSKAEVHHNRPQHSYQEIDEDRAFEKAQTSLYELEQFIRKHPRSRHVSRAKRKIISYLQCGEEWKSYALAIANFTDISGALYDSSTGFFYIIGDSVTRSEEGLPLPPLLIDDIMTILKVIEQNEFPGVSIEPARGMYSKTNIAASTHSIRYIPESIRDTHLGYVLYEIDRQLKSLSHGRDTITNEPINIGGQEYIPEHELADMSHTSPGFFGRMWFKPKKSSIYHESNKIWFKKYRMGVLAESDDPAPHFFASHLEINFDEFAKEISAFRELVRIGKIVALAIWLKQNGIFIEPDVLNNYTFLSMKTPSETPVLKGVIGREKIVEGEKILIREQFLIGGVNLATRNDYEFFSKTSLSSQLKNEIIFYWSVVNDEIKAPKNKIFWDISKGEKKYSVVRFPLTKKSLRR